MLPKAVDGSLHKTVVVIVGFVIAVGAIAQIGQRVAKHLQQRVVTGNVKGQTLEKWTRAILVGQKRIRDLIFWWYLVFVLFCAHASVFGVKNTKKRKRQNLTKAI